MKQQNIQVSSFSTFYDTIGNTHLFLCTGSHSINEIKFHKRITFNKLFAITCKLFAGKKSLGIFKFGF